MIFNYEEDGSDDESVTESEFAAFCEEESAAYRKFWEEEVLPRNPDWVFKDYSLVTREGDVCNGNAKVEAAAPESNRDDDLFHPVDPPTL